MNAPRGERPEDAADDGGAARTSAPPSAPPARAAAGRRFRTFDSVIDVPAFRWYLLSTTGDWSALHMQGVVRGLLAYQLTGSFAALGIVELGNTVPRMFLALYGGMLADRTSRRVILQATWVINAIASVVLAWLVFTGRLRIEHLVIGAFVQGVTNSFALPARQAMVPEIVGPDRMMNAFALNIFNLNMLRLVAPAIAAGTVAAVGGGWVFVMMAVLYGFASAAMFPIPATTAATRAALAGRMPDEDGVIQPGEKGALSEIMDGIRYVRASHVLIALLLLQLFGAMLAFPYQRLMPGFVDVVLAGGDDKRTAILVGTLLTFTAVGALLGSLLIASLPSRRRGWLMIGSLVVFGIALIAFSASTVIWISAAIAIVVGFGQSGRMSLLNVLVQANTHEAYRGRVSAVLMLDDGIESLGVLGIAMLADTFGPQLALGGVGVGLIALAGILWLTRIIRDLD